MQVFFLHNQIKFSLLKRFEGSKFTTTINGTNMIKMILSNFNDWLIMSDFLIISAFFFQYWLFKVLLQPFQNTIT